MKWKKIKGYPNYRINEYGDVYSIVSDIFLKPHINPSGIKYVGLSRKGETKMIMLSTLVLDTFKPSKTDINRYAWHLDLELENCADYNLERCSRGDRKRLFAVIKGKKRGVYSYPHGKKKWRVTFKNRAGQTKTFGYYKNKWFAELRYVQFYKKEFGMLPYLE